MALKSIEIYTDGSCINKVGGWGVVMVHENEIFFSEGGKVPEETSTNNRAEFFAIYVALHNIYKNQENFENVQLFSDSQYCIKSLNEWSKKWLINGWKKSNGKKVENKKLIVKLLNLIKKIRENNMVLELFWIGRDTSKYNTIADSLAKNGTK